VHTELFYVDDVPPEPLRHLEPGVEGITSEVTVVLDGRTGILVRYGDETALADAMRQLLLNRERRHALGREAARYVAAERSLEAASAKLGAALSAL